jgi:hypothetical protein
VHVGAQRSAAHRAHRSRDASRSITSGFNAASRPKRATAAAEAASDVYAIGACSTSSRAKGRRTSTEGVMAIIAEATAADPDARPSATELVRKLAARARWSSARRCAAPRSKPRGRRAPVSVLQLGRFELVKQLGAGAMGEVWEVAR